MTGRLPDPMNTDLSQRVVVDASNGTWHASPHPGVERLYLAREELPDRTIASSFVRYAPGAAFEPHVHENGEELFVLAGAFGDEYGTYPTGTYIHNPPGSSHTPNGAEGCLLFVKQQQLKKGDAQRSVIQTLEEIWHPGMVKGLQVMPLHQFETEHAALVKWAPNTRFNPHRHWGGEEILVLEGVFRDEHGVYPKHTWIRSPHMSQHTPFTEIEGCTILVKTGHL
jgi:anti-sigma factor ChrR (cupin superfamily)